MSNEWKIMPKFTPRVIEKISFLLADNREELEREGNGESGWLHATYGLKYLGT